MLFSTYFVFVVLRSVVQTDTNFVVLRFCQISLQCSNCCMCHASR